MIDFRNPPREKNISYKISEDGKLGALYLSIPKEIFNKLVLGYTARRPDFSCTLFKVEGNIVSARLTFSREMEWQSI